MIIKGGPRGKGGQLGVHLMRTDTNETVQVFGRRGVYSRTVRGAMQEMEGIAAGSKATQPLYHVSINPEINETLTPAQWQLAADRLEKALGLEGHQRIMVQHLKKDRTHMHVVWSRVDINTMKVAHHSHNYRTHEEVARALEREFGLNRTQGVHVERDGQERKPKRPKTKESMQEAVTGWKKADAQAMIAAAWNASKNGAAFQAYLKKGGYRLAAGDTRDFVVVDPSGGVHGIRSGVKGLLIADIRSRFGDLDQTQLPRIAAAKKAIKAQRHVEKVNSVFPAKPPRPVQAQPDRYIVLSHAEQVAKVNRNIGYRQDGKTLEYAPTPPSWTQEPERPVSKPWKMTPVQIPMGKASDAMQTLRAKQDEIWREERNYILHLHSIANWQIEAHQAARLAACTDGIDERLKELNSLSSRAGALFNRTERDREIAYLVAKRQRSLAEETARQQKVIEDLRRDQERELAVAKGKHDRLAALQQLGLVEIEKLRARKTQAARSGTGLKPPDFER